MTVTATLTRPLPPGRPSHRPVAWILAAGVVLLASGAYVPYVTPAVGFAGLLGVPTYIVLSTSDWREIYWRERVLLSLGVAIVAVMGIGFVVDLALPLVGVARPLDRVPLLVTYLLAWTILWLRRRARWTPVLPVLRNAGLGRYDVTVGAIGAAAVAVAVVGANRLNNFAGSTAAVLAQVLVVAAVCAALAWAPRLAAGTSAVVVYLAGLALLFQTSLRGWFISGHDIQNEYFVFHAAATSGHWTFASVQNAYNTCLSITILPTAVLRFTGVDGPYVYKFFFQLLFAFSGVLAYAIAARLLSRRLAIVSALFFIGFTTFFTDMPFLNRQEVAFLLTGCAFLLFLVDELPVHRRRRWEAIFVIGTVVAHYSTSYLLLGVLVIAKILELLARRRRSEDGRMARTPTTVVMLVVATGICLAWGSGASHSDSHLASTIKSVENAVTGTTASSRSASASYSLFGLGAPSLPHLMHQYVASTLHVDKAARPTVDAVAAAYPARIVPLPNLPPTQLGARLDSAGISVVRLNDLLRSSAARLLQLLVGAGLLAYLVRRRFRSAIPRDFYFLALASTFMVGLQVVLPVITEDYGLLRAFQQALLVLSPFVTIGCVWIIGVLGRRLAVIGAAGIAVVLLGSLSGLIPQLLGGYPAQLTLNNSGQYYDLYYVSAQQVAAAQWLGSHAPYRSPLATTGLDAQQLTNHVDFRYAGDIYPTLLAEKTPFVYLGYTEVSLHQSTVSESGSFLTYRYPIGYIDASRNLVYANPDARIYR